MNAPRWSLALGLAAALLAAGCGKPDAPPKSADDIDYSGLRQYPLDTLASDAVTVGGHRIPVWIMNDDPKRAEGFMYLRKDQVPDGHAMLFVFENPSAQDFWMKDTPMALDIAFLDAGGTVLNVGEGEPLDESHVESKGAAKYVLEFKQGEAAGLGVKPGVKVEIPAKIAPE